MRITLKTIILSILLPITLGIFSNVIFTWITLEKREPTFIVNPLRSKIFHQELLTDQGLKVSDKYGNRINGDVNIVNFYFYNSGKVPIKAEDILDTLRLTFSGNIKVLDYRILKQSRELCKIEFGMLDTLKKILPFNFRVLEENDGFTGQLTYAGADDNLRLQGAIVGITDFSARTDKYLQNGFFIGLICFVGFLFYFFSKGNDIDQAEKNGSPSSLTQRLTESYSGVIYLKSNPKYKASFNFSYAKVFVVLTSLFIMIFSSSLFLSEKVFLEISGSKEKSSFEKANIPKSILPN